MLRNKLSINVNKSHAIIYSTFRVNRQVHYIVLCDDLIPISTNVKYLGVFIDSKLTFNYNIDQVPYHIMLNLYYSLVYPHLQYCNVIWGCAPISYINKILLLQKIVRIITKSNYLAHTDEISSRTNILKIDDLNKYLLGI